MKLDLLKHQMMHRYEYYIEICYFPYQSVEIAEIADENNSVIQKRLVLQKANELMEAYFID